MEEQKSSILRDKSQNVSSKQLKNEFCNYKPKLRIGAFADYPPKGAKWCELRWCGNGSRTLATSPLIEKWKLKCKCASWL